MLNRSASLAMSTRVLEALPGKLDIKRHSPSILYFYVIFLLVFKWEFTAYQISPNKSVFLFKNNPKHICLFLFLFSAMIYDVSLSL